MATEYRVVYGNDALGFSPTEGLKSLLYATQLANKYQGKVQEREITEWQDA